MKHPLVVTHVMRCLRKRGGDGAGLSATGLCKLESKGRDTGEELV